mgnify:CR=1 FL=1
MTFTAGTLDSWTATISTARTVDTVTTAGAICQATIDAKNLANGDVLLIEILVKVDTAETEQLAWSGTFANALPEPLIFSPQISCVGASVKFKVTQTAGTGRAFKARLSYWS